MHYIICKNERGPSPTRAFLQRVSIACYAER